MKPTDDAIPPPSCAAVAEPERLLALPRRRAFQGRRALRFIQTELASARMTNAQGRE
jgi:hypothetical protein